MISLSTSRTLRRCLRLQSYGGRALACFNGLRPTQPLPPTENLGLHSKSSAYHSTSTTSESYQHNTSTSSSSFRHWTPPQRRLLQAVLEEHVHEYGWTQDAITAAAAAEANARPQSISSAGLVTDSDLVAYCLQDWNERLQRDLSSTLDQGRSRTERLAQALERRLRYQVAYKTHWHYAMALGARPDNLPTTVAQLQTMMDIVVSAVDGNSSSSSSTEKLSLGVIFCATELHLLTDTSEDCRDTWGFLRQQLQHWEQGLGLLPSTSLGDAWYVTSSVASALLSGAASLLLSPTSYTSKIAEQLWTSLVQTSAPPFASPTTAAKGKDEASMDGSDPSHYDKSPEARWDATGKTPTTSKL